MSTNFDSKIKDLLARKSAADEAAKRQAEEAQRLQDERQKQTQAVLVRWRECKDAFRGVINDVENMSNKTIRFNAHQNPAEQKSYGHQPRTEIAKLEAAFILDGKDTNTRLSFSVHENGDVRIDQLAPGGGVTTSHVDKLDQAKLEELVTGFLDKALPSKPK